MSDQTATGRTWPDPDRWDRLLDLVGRSVYEEQVKLHRRRAVRYVLAGVFVGAEGTEVFGTGENRYVNDAEFYAKVNIAADLIEQVFQASHNESSGQSS